MLGQHLALYDAFQIQLQDCDREVQSFLEELANHAQAPQHELSAPRTRFRRQANVPRFDIRPLLHRLTGTDLTQIDSIGPYTAMCLVSEIGTDMSRRATEKHFTSWLTLCPDNKITGERILSSLTRPSASRAASPVTNECRHPGSQPNRARPLLPTTRLPVGEAQSGHRHCP